MSPRPILVALVAGLLTLLAAAWPSGPRALAGVPSELPAGPVILTVEGAIAQRNDGDRMVLDRAMIEALPQSLLTTWTPWTGSEPVRFEGVLLEVLLERLGASGSVVECVALNDYKAEIPVEDLRRHGVLLALRRDGAYMPVRDKGPLWVVYPLEAGRPVPADIESRMVWQLTGMVVR